MTERTLTDDDVKAIVTALENRMTEKFYLDVGRGLIGLAWKGFLAAVLFIAAYGAYRSTGS